MSEQTNTTTPSRPDLSVLHTDVAGPDVLCLNGPYLTQLVAYIEHLERATGVTRDYTMSPQIATAYLIVKVMEDHVTRGMFCLCGVPIGDSVDMRWHLANQIERALKQRGVLS